MTTRTVTLTHVAGGMIQRKAWADRMGVWVDWGLAGRYEVTKSPKAKTFRYLKQAGGWMVSQEDMNTLLKDHYEARDRKAEQ